MEDGQGRSEDARESAAEGDAALRLEHGRYVVRLADTEEEIAASQRLRYSVFVDEMGATPTPESRAERREQDRFDPFCSHLILLDNSAYESGGPPPVVGVYRLLHRTIALGTPEAPGPGFYTANEYDLGPILRYPSEALELGRSCVAQAYRGKAGMQLLWIALSQYIVIHKVGLMFGTASFHGSEVEPLKVPLSYLWHNHLAPEDLRPRALDAHYVAMNLVPESEIDKRTALQMLPALMKGYMRLGGFVGDGAFIDREFNTVDVCLVMDTTRLSERYTKGYDRRRADRVLG
ncbi:MAG: GNAT family N-acyltransferase [Pseudomonadota bacterium]